MEDPSAGCALRCQWQQKYVMVSAEHSTSPSGQLSPGGRHGERAVSGLAKPILYALQGSSTAGRRWVEWVDWAEAPRGWTPVGPIADDNARSQAFDSRRVWATSCRSERGPSRFSLYLVEHHKIGSFMMRQQEMKSEFAANFVGAIHIWE